MITLQELRAVVRREPESVMARLALGRAFARRGEFRRARHVFRRATVRHPGDPRPFEALGDLLGSRCGSEEEACRCYERAIALDPGRADPREALGRLHAIVLHQNAEARPVCLDVIAACPDRANPYASLCRSWVNEMDTADAWRCAQAALPPRGRPDLLAHGFARALLGIGRYRDARAHLAALPWLESSYRLLALLARAEEVLGDREAAAACYERALRLAPGDLGVTGQWLELRWRHGDHDGMRQWMRAWDELRRLRLAPPDPIWDPATVRGRTVLLQNDGGFGDTVQWSRAAMLFADAGARVLLECRTPLRRLLATTRGAEAVVVPHDAYPPFDLACRCDLALSMADWDWPRMAARIPYLRVPAPIAGVRASGTGRTGGASRALHARSLQVGVEWRSEMDLRKDDPYLAKSVPLDLLAPLAHLPDTSCHSLHVGEAGVRELRAQAQRVPFTELRGPRDDFRETAAAIAAVDVIVSVDSAVAHVAGALGKPTLLMLPYYADARWGSPAAPAPWYPSCRLFRQTEPGDWTPVVAGVTAALREMRDARPAEPQHAV